MKNLLIKEIKLASSPLSFLFIAFALLTFCPGYPILVGGFFVMLGLFQSFQYGREANDILYSVLLPIKKTDTVKAKYIFCVFIEICAFVLSAAVTLIRMTVLRDLPAYRNNALMTANPAFLGFLLLIFAEFNGIFVCGFFKTAYKFSKPFILFIITSLLTVGTAETLWHIPGLEFLNSFGFGNIIPQTCVLAAGVILFILITFLAERKAEKHFSKIDL